MELVGSVGLGQIRNDWTSSFVRLVHFSRAIYNQFHSLVISHNYVVSPNKINTSGSVSGLRERHPGRPGKHVYLSGAGRRHIHEPEYLFWVTPGCGGGKPEVEVGTNLNVPQQTLIRKYQFRDDFSWTADGTV